MSNTQDCHIIFTADDLGRTLGVNDAIFEAHHKGLITSAGLMAGGAAFSDAAKKLQGNSSLSVGIHIALCDALPVLDPLLLSEITTADGALINSPAAAWRRIAAPEAISQATAEIEAQFSRLAEHHIRPCYVDGHHHIHMHPAIFEIICRVAADYGVRWIRIPYEPLFFAVSNMNTGRGIMPLIEWSVFRMLKLRNIRTARRYGIRFPDYVFGLSGTGAVSEPFIMNAIDTVSRKGRPSVCEIFGHPDQGTEPGVAELSAFMSERASEKLDYLGIKRIGYRDI